MAVNRRLLEERLNLESGANAEDEDAQKESPQSFLERFSGRAQVSGVQNLAKTGPFPKPPS